MKLLIQSRRCIDAPINYHGCASLRTYTSSSPLPLAPSFLCTYFLSTIFAALFNDRPFNENVPGWNGTFIAPTRFWHDRWFICFDNTVVAFRCNHPAKRQNVSIDLRTFAISCFGYRVSSVSIALPYYRNLKDKKSRWNNFEIVRAFL